MQELTAEVFRLRSFFDWHFYERQVGRSFLTADIALLHYLQEGHALGAAPSSSFDGHAYLQAYPDVAAAGMNPLRHYVVHGRAEGREVFNFIGPLELVAR